MAGRRTRVLFLNPPYLPRFSRAQRSPAVIKSGTLYYPIWLAYAAGVLEDDGFPLRLLDAPALGYDTDAVLAQTLDFRPDLVVADTSTPSIANDLAVMGSIREQLPQARIVLVGTHASATAREILTDRPEVDAVCRGEYELTLRNLARGLEDGAGPVSVPGLLTRKNAEIEDGGEREPVLDLDSLPWVSRVYRRHLPISRYFYSITRHPVVALVTGRGCPYRCHFCVYPQTLHGRGYRHRSPEDVVDEILWIQREMPGVREIFFEDDTLTVNRSHVTRICELMLERGVRVPWTANSRCDVEAETLRLMRRAGCRLLCVGVESGNQEVLDATGKNLRLEQVERFAADARSAGILLHGCFMVGNPGETPDTMEETFRFARRLPFDTVQFFPLMVYPGTRAYDWARENGYLRTEDYSEWLDSEGSHNCVLDLPGLTAEDLVRFCDRARRRYYLRPSYIGKKAVQAATHPRETVRLLRAARALGRHLLRRG